VAILAVALLVPAAAFVPTVHRLNSMPDRRVGVAVTSMQAPAEAPAPTASLLESIKEAASENKLIAENMKLSSPVAFGLSYAIVELTFFAIALPIGYIGWHASTGEWLQPLILLQEGGNEDKVRLLGLVASYIVLLKTLFPLRLGSTLLLTPKTRAFLDSVTLPGLPGLGDGSRRESRREDLKSELRSLAAMSQGGFDGLAAEDATRLREVIAELEGLCPVAEPARDPSFSGEWECLWTTEKEINFVVGSGLFGLPWQRTYQTIDVAGGRLENVIEFASGGFLRVGSTIAPDPDDADGRRFNFAFEQCALRWRSIEVPLPPVGKGWGALLYLDQEMRIQRDVRGDLLVATRC